MRIAILLLSLAPVLARAELVPIDPQPPAIGRLSAAQWSDDVDTLVRLLRETHPDLNAAVSQQELERETRTLKDALATLDRYQILGGLIRITALAQDDSTFIYPFQERVGFSLIPVLAYWFSDGLYVIDAQGEARRFVGHRITQIGGTPVDRAFMKLAPYLSGENMQGKRFLFTRNAFIPELLYAAGLSTSANSASFTFQSPEGLEETVILAPAAADAWKSWGARVVSFDPDEAMFARHADDVLWMDLDEDSGTLFIRARELRDQDELSVAEFAGRLRELADTEELQRVVIDARYGGGGSGHAMDPLVNVITTHPEINRAGRLFGLIGRVTRGTVLEFISVLENNSRMVLVGESTLDAPNGVGDPVLATLPNSGIEVAITEVFWPTSFADDPRQAIVPDVRVMYSHEDWLRARDPALAAIRSHQHRPTRQPVSSSVMEQLAGRYEIGPGQTMAIMPEGDSLSFTIRDSEEEAGESFFRARGSLYAENGTRLSSDIRDVFIEFDSTSDGIDQPRLIWRGVTKPLSRLSQPAGDGSGDATAQDTGA